MYVGLRDVVLRTPSRLLRSQPFPLIGEGNGGAGTIEVAGGNKYGGAELDRIYIGSGGGGGAASGTAGGKGGNGGIGSGSLFIGAHTLSLTGAINADGAYGIIYSGNGGGGGGGGSGGSIRIEAYTISMGAGTASAAGGNGGAGAYAPYGSGGAGSKGRIAVYYENSFSAGFTPNYLFNTGATIVDSIFEDGFESGDFTAWSTSVTDSGDLAVTTSADFYGQYGMAATINDTNQLYVQDASPTDETGYRARFYLDPNGLTMGAGDVLNLLMGGAIGTNYFRGLTAEIAGVALLDSYSNADVPWDGEDGDIQHATNWLYNYGIPMWAGQSEQGITGLVDFGTELNEALDDFTWTQEHYALATDFGALQAIINCFWVTYNCDVTP